MKDSKGKIVTTMSTPLGACGNARTSSSQVVCNGLTSRSVSNLMPQTNGGLVQQRTNIRASSAKYYDIASTILGGSSDVEELFLNSAKNGNCKKLEQLLHQSTGIGLNVNCVDKRTGNTALIWASKKGHSKIVELLMRHGADATLCNYEAQTALETAFSRVRTIILDWIDTQEELDERLLLQAAWQGNFYVVTKILNNKSNINVNCQNAEGLTPLMLVCRDIHLFERLSSQLNRHYSPVQVAEELMKSKADIHVTDIDGRSCLHYTSQSHAESAESLLKALVSGGLDLELRDKRLLTPLHLASQSGNTNNVASLADRGSDVNAKSFAGLTPLHMTAFKDHYATALTLLKYGADVTIKDDQGLTPVDVAKTKKMKNALKKAWDVATKGSNPPPDAATDGVNIYLEAPVPCQTTKPSQSKVLSNVDRCKQMEKKVQHDVETLKIAHPVLQRETTRILGTSRTKILPKIRQSTSPEHTSKTSQGNVDSKPCHTKEKLDHQRSLEDSKLKLTSRDITTFDITTGVGRSSERLTRFAESSFVEGQSSRLSRTTPVQQDLFKLKNANHHRSDSDLAAPNFRDVSASSDNILQGTKSNSTPRMKPSQLSLSRDIPACHFHSKNDSDLLDKGSSHQEEDILLSPSAVFRSCSILKEEFILEESRPGEANSCSDLVSSISSGSQSSSSPRDMPFSQPSSSRMLKYDHSLSTLIEQHTSTDFSLSDSVVCCDGKPLIMKPHKRLRRRSDNSLSSSLELDTNDLPFTEIITRSNSLKISGNRSCSNNQEPPGLNPPVCTYKSQSMESILQKSHPEISEDRLASVSAAPKTDSEENVVPFEKNSMCIVNPHSCQTDSDKMQMQSKTEIAAVKCIKPSKKSVVESLLGAPVSSNIKDNNNNNSSTGKQDVFNKSTDISQKLMQNNSTGVGITTKYKPKNVSVSLKDLGQRKSAQQQKLHSARSIRSPAISEKESLAVNTSCSNTRTISHDDIAIQTHRLDEARHFSNSEEPKQLESARNEKLNVEVMMRQSKVRKANNVKPTIKQTGMTTREDCGSRLGSVSENCVVQKKLPVDVSQVKIKVANNILQKSSNKCTKSRAVDNSDLQFSFATAKPSKQTVPDVPIMEASSKTFCGEGEVGFETSEKSCLKLDSIPTKVLPKYILKDQEFNKPILDILAHSLMPNPNIQLPASSLKQSSLTFFHSTAAKPVISTSHLNNAVISTPVIVNPFEEFVQNHIRVIDNTAVDAVAKLKKPHSNKVLNKHSKKTTVIPGKRQNSAILRQVPSGKRLTKAKDSRTEKESRLKSGRKSAKGQQNKKGEKTTQMDIGIEAAKPNTAIISGIGWQLSASCIDVGSIQVSGDLHVSSSDSDFSVELDQQESLPQENILNEMNIVKTNSFPETVSETISRSVITKEHHNSVLNIKHPITKSDPIPVTNSDMTQDTQERMEQRHQFSNYVTMSNEMFQESRGRSVEKNENLEANIVEELNLNKLTCFPLTPSSPSALKTFSDGDVSFKASHLPQDVASPPEVGNKIQTSRVTGNNFKSSEEIDNLISSEEYDSTEHQHDEDIFHVKTEDQAAGNYEYTPSGKTVRKSQSFNGFQKIDNRRLPLKCSELHNKNDSFENSSNYEEDMDDIIEEILSSTASSMTSTLRTTKSYESSSHLSGVHTLTENDRKLLLKMSSSKYNSPFHASTSKIFSSAPNFPETDINKQTKCQSGTSCLLSTNDRSEQNIAHQEELKLPTLASSTNGLASFAPTVSKKPPQFVKSFLQEERDHRPVSLRRTASSNEHKRQPKNVRNGVPATEDSKHLIKILSSYRHMELQASANFVEKCNGQSKGTSKVGNNDQSSMSQQVSGVASFRSKARFQEIKDSTRINISAVFRNTRSSAESVNHRLTHEENTLEKGTSDALVIPAAGTTSAYVIPASLSYEEESHLNLNPERGSTAGSNCTFDDIKCGDGDTIQWKKGNVLGRGAFGTVWCGLTNEGQLIAVKQIELTILDESKAQHEYEKVQEEVELLKTLQHFNIVSYLGTSLEDNMVSIFMQFIPGGSIASLLARFGALEESVFKRYTKQILEGVKYLHSNDIIHRDIKGANVMLMPNGVIKLIDFGCAKRLCINMSISQTELLKSMNGTPFWMAPEVVNESGHGKKSDIWSIGCTVFEMATRKPPWAEMNPMAAIFAIGSPSRPVPTLDNKFSHDARDFVSRCMTRDQEVRPGASELQEHPFITGQIITRPSRSDN